MAALGGMAIGIAVGYVILELRSRTLAIALRRLTELAASIDGRVPEDSPRQGFKVELERLSSEVLWTARRVAKERKEFEERHAAWDAQFAASLDAMLVLDAAGSVRQINPAAERLFRIKAEETYGVLLADILLPPNHRALDHAAFLQDLAAGKAQGRRQEIVVHCGARQFPIELAIAEFTCGGERGLVATARDISTHRQARADLKRVREQADRLQARLRNELASRRQTRMVSDPLAAAIKGAAPPESVGGTPFTLEEVCGDAIRRMVVKAERKGLGFRYEDSEVQGLGLIGDSTRLRNVVVELIEGVVRCSESGEIVVHISALSTDERTVELTTVVSATAMNEDQSTRVGRPLNDPVKPDRRNAARGATRRDRVIEVAGAEVAVRLDPVRGVRFTASLHYAADLSRVTFDLGAPAGPEASRAKPVDLDPQLLAEFARAAARLRTNADKLNLGALWAQAHRLKEIWLPCAPPADTGLVSALAHTARGGDAANAQQLARRLAEALDQTVREHVARHEPEAEAETEEASA
jgi:PAS domain S-box-containing protein